MLLLLLGLTWMMSVNARVEEDNVANGRGVQVDLFLHVPIADADRPKLKTEAGQAQVVDQALSTRPSAYVTAPMMIARRSPIFSAMAPKIGWPMPQARPVRPNFTGIAYELSMMFFYVIDDDVVWMV